MSEPKEGTETAFWLERKCPNCGSAGIIRDYSSSEATCEACGRGLDDKREPEL